MSRVSFKPHSPQSFSHHTCKLFRLAFLLLHFHEYLVPHNSFPNPSSVSLHSNQCCKIYSDGTGNSRGKGGKHPTSSSSTSIVQQFLNASCLSYKKLCWNLCLNLRNSKFCVITWPYFSVSCSFFHFVKFYEHNVSNDTMNLYIFKYLLFYYWRGSGCSRSKHIVSSGSLF